MKLFQFSHAAIDVDSGRTALGDPAAGGYASFEGWVRNHNEGLPVTRLEYEAFEELAIKEGERIVAAAIERFGVEHASCIHRVGSLAIGDMAVWVGVSARHRAEAFAACRFIIDEVKHRVPIWKKEHYVNGDSGWVNCERCAAHADASAEHSHDHHHLDSLILTEAQSASPDALLPDYSRQMTLREVGAAGQAKLSAARILVVGAGGLGVPVLSYLAGAGVGTLGIADGDVLEASNLHRQTLYRLQDVALPKAQLAARSVRALNPQVNVVIHAERVTATNALQLLSQYDVVVECSDNFSTKFTVNDAAVLLGKPAVFASVYQFEGQLQIYRPDRDSACLRCLWPEATRDGLVGNCAEAGVLGPVPGVLGSLQALETLKLVLGIRGQLHEELLLFDLLTLETRKLRARRCNECVGKSCQRIHSLQPSSAIPEMEVQFANLDGAIAAGYTLIDVRDETETRAAPLRQDHRQIPAQTVLERIDDLARETKYLLVCARGIRSRAIAQALRERGLANVYSLAGGVLGLKLHAQSS
jgi:adenylyltransferase/sulfurtransferase